MSWYIVAIAMYALCALCASNSTDNINYFTAPLLHSKPWLLCMQNT